MNLWNYIKEAIHGRSAEYIQTKFNEMILIIAPRHTATLIAEPGSETIVSGFAGSVWIQVQGRELGYTLKHGDTYRIPATGKIVFWAATENVKCRVHVIYYPPAPVIH